MQKQSCLWTKWNMFLKGNVPGFLDNVFFLWGRGLQKGELKNWKLRVPCDGHCCHCHCRGQVSLFSDYQENGLIFSKQWDDTLCEAVRLSP